MSSAPSGFELVVGDDGSIAASQLRRLGVKPGSHLVVIAAGPERERDESLVRRRFSFVGALKDAPSDLSERADEYLSGGFGSS